MSSTATAKGVEVKERPFILSGAKVRAILEGRKTQERRLVTIPKWLSRMEPDLNRMYPGKALGVTPCLFVCCADGSQQRLRNPYGWPDVQPIQLWGRESLRCNEQGIFYDADNTRLDPALVPANLKRIAEFNDPFHMPRWAARITLEITNVRVQRIQDISCADVLAEGSPVPLREHSNPELGIQCVSAKEWFSEEWNRTNAKRGNSWESNPWTWAITFKKL